MPAKIKAECDNHGSGEVFRPARSAVLAFASCIRTWLRFHQQSGIEYYPLIPGLQQILTRKQEKPGTAGCLEREPQPLSPLRADKALPLRTVALADQPASVQRDIEDCRGCALSAARQGQVLGVGTVTARLLIIGDYSSQGAEFSAATLFGTTEDAMLWNMMRAIGLTPAEVYVTNTVKCCPQPALQPGAESEERCRVYLRREIELVRPRLICAMGEAAAHAVLGGSEPVVRLRGRFHAYQCGGETGHRIPVMVTFHPRFLLKCAEMKKAAWQDLQMIQRRLQTL